MKIFLDTTDLDAVTRWLPHGIVDGVTTNPTLLRKAGVDNAREMVRELARQVAPGDVSIQVAGETHDEMVQQALGYRTLGENIVIKVPVIRPDGRPNLDVMATLSRQGIPVNATACLSLAQVLAAAKAGARYASLLWGRVADEGGSPEAVVADAARLLRRFGLSTQLLIGSVRTAGDITKALSAGADVVTVPPALLERWLDHHYSRVTVQQFNADAGLKAGTK
ncbi:transaldolase family protein [Streptomyces sp.]|uniref:transaldolase family protein n=1 Tax=Streptomyces sp. TaxID=1931 RepID=UPI002CEADD37|nr:transaldolase family protein [Streptomyces sp.]HLL34503.1 transaldolase family protein [Streptomyces sp.]HZF86894.1 transaldolase family protein [Streptomyces sp.]